MLYYSFLERGLCPLFFRFGLRSFSRMDKDQTIMRMDGDQTIWGSMDPRLCANRQRPDYQTKPYAKMDEALCEDGRSLHYVRIGSPTTCGRRELRLYKDGRSPECVSMDGALTREDERSPDYVRMDGALNMWRWRRLDYVSMFRAMGSKWIHFIANTNLADVFVPQLM